MTNRREHDMICTVKILPFNKNKKKEKKRNLSKKKNSGGLTDAWISCPASVDIRWSCQPH